MRVSWCILYLIMGHTKEYLFIYKFWQGKNVTSAEQKWGNKTNVHEYITQNRSKTYVGIAGTW